MNKQKLQQIKRKIKYNIATAFVLMALIPAFILIGCVTAAQWIKKQFTTEQ